MKSIAILALTRAAAPAHAGPFKEMRDRFEPLRKLADLRYAGK